MKSLRILIYDTNYVKGVSGMIVLLKIKYWQKKGSKITILCTKEGEEFYKSKLNNVDFIPIDYSYKINGLFSLPWQYVKVTLHALPHLPSIRGKFDIVYSHTGVIDFLVSPWILKFFDKKVKWFVAVDNLVPPPNKRPGNFFQKAIPYFAFLLGNQLLKKADGIFVVTNFLRNYYQSRGYHVIKTGDGYGIDIDIFTGEISSKAPIFDAVYAGRIHEAKGVFDLVEVVKEVVRKKKDFKLGIMGIGDETIKKELSEKIAIYELQKNIVFTGYVTGKQKGDILRNAGFFLFLSYDEGCPHAVIEAFAVNKLVVAYNLPIYHEVFAKYIKSSQMILFKEKQFDTIAHYIVEAKPNKNHFNNKLEQYTWDKIVKKELASMQEIMSDKS